MTATSTEPNPRPRLDIHGARVPGADLSYTILHDANLAGANATDAIFVGADFKGANLDGTVLKGADLTDAKNLTIEQLSAAQVDQDTVLPTYIDRDKLLLHKLKS